MANGVEKESVLMMFSDEELREISGVKRGGDYIEVTCGCTSHRYGDAVGRLRVFSNGDLEITCECTPGCNEVTEFSFISCSYNAIKLHSFDSSAFEVVSILLSSCWEAE
ncbi:hypothetical protein WN944_010588 [Citrus x changshan-huyou]|uniref:ULTRAPETALA1/2 SAND domain-containing protein n=1 Tax=Citrus x changshan-huyou TaxID=2935761 RepID=A0AAP0MUF2_9ROSI